MKGNYRMFARLRRGPCHRSGDPLVIAFACYPLVGQPQDVGTMCQVASSRSKASLGLAPRGCPAGP